MSNARKIAATTIAAIAIAALGAAPANAVRPIAGYDYPDRCTNIRGTQTAIDIAAGYWQFKTRTPRQDDCRRGWRATMNKHRH